MWKCVVILPLLGACASARPAPEASPAQPGFGGLGSQEGTHFEPSILPGYAPRMGCEVSTRDTEFPTCGGIRVSLQAIHVRHFRPPHTSVHVAAKIAGNNHARFLVVPTMYAFADGIHGDFPAKLDTMTGTGASLFGATLEVHAVHPGFEVRRVQSGESTIDSLHVEGWCHPPTRGGKIELVFAKDVRLGGTSVDTWLEGADEHAETAKEVPTPEGAPITFDGACRVVATIEGELKAL